MAIPPEETRADDPALYDEAHHIVIKVLTGSFVTIKSDIQTIKRLCEFLNTQARCLDTGAVITGDLAPIDTPVIVNVTLYRKDGSKIGVEQVGLYEIAAAAFEQFQGFLDDSRLVDGD